MDFEFQGAQFTGDELCRALALSGQLDDLLLEALRARCMPEWAERLGVSVDDDQVQAFADEYRARHGLHEAQATEAFLARAGMDEEGFFAYCQAQALRRAVRDQLGNEEAVREFFLAHPGDFDQARISRLVVREAELASELRMRIAEDGEDFHALARQHSLDEQTRPAGGYAGLVRREDLGHEAAARVFSSEPGALVGPLAEGEQHLLILVEEVVKSRLDDEAREVIRDRLLEEWEQAMMSEARPA
jgi:parvulin-like peptidyl-prolyl isomerase